MPNLEQLAREYRRALEDSSVSDVSGLEQLIILEENQLDYINALYPKVPSSSRRTVNYVKNIIFRILQKLNFLLKKDAYVPSFRNVNVPCSSLVSNLLNTQISIFAIYDKIALPYNDLAEVLSLENRKTSFLRFI